MYVRARTRPHSWKCVRAFLFWYVRRPRRCGWPVEREGHRLGKLTYVYRREPLPIAVQEHNKYASIVNHDTGISSQGHPCRPHQIQVGVHDAEGRRSLLQVYYNSLRTV